ncbi:hypothetical protein EJB05_08889, partial [Eragrostis curvula]
MMPSDHLVKPSLFVVAFWLERSPPSWSAVSDEGVLTQVSISSRLKTELLLFLGSSSTVEMDPSLVVVTPDVESVPRNAEIPSPPPERSELVDSCQLLPEGSKGTFCLPRKSSFLGLLGKRKLSEVSNPSQDIISSLGTALPSIDVAVPPSQSSNPDASSSGSLELDVEAMLSSINDDVQASGPLESAARKVRFPKVELG